MSKIYVIFDKESWEIHGIDKAFTTHEKAIAYLEQFRDYIETRGNQTFEEFCDSEINVINVD